MEVPIREEVYFLAYGETLLQTNFSREGEEAAAGDNTARHGVSPRQAAEIIGGDPVVLNCARAERRRGRAIPVVYTLRNRRVRVVTALAARASGFSPPSRPA